jgi:hypothetical protein
VARRYVEDIAGLHFDHAAMSIAAATVELDALPVTELRRASKN